jgi:hypothetical protein
MALAVPARATKGARADRRPTLGTAAYALREYRHDGLVAHALETVSQLQEEGVAMHHCLETLALPWEPTVELFAEGALRFFSIRETGRGERVATLEIERATTPERGWLASARGRPTSRSRRRPWDLPGASRRPMPQPMTRWRHGRLGTKAA